MKHPYDRNSDCQCNRCVKERARRAEQTAVSNASAAAYRIRARRSRHCAVIADRVATREEQHARYIDCGPQAWDDRD